MIRGASEAGHDVFCICHTYDLQKRARDLVAQGLAEGAPWVGDADAVDARLRALVPPRSEQRSTLPSGSSLAEAIAGRAITVHEDPRNLLPIRDRRTLLLLPTLTSLTGVENPLRGEEDGSELVAALGEGVTVHPLSMAPSAAEIADALERAKGFERLLVVTTNARFLPAQRALLCAAVEQHPGAIHLAIRSPFDAEVLPKEAPATVVLTYGFRPVQLRALADVLLGKVQAYGRCPVGIRRN
ncbi:MAG TPA: hypothetical protein PKA37_03975, partial [Planctomycetota bacterium]|nr:hypothetical protein [Planctomycetota bacterium]